MDKVSSNIMDDYWDAAMTYHPKAELKQINKEGEFE
jgi:hypothetical protein